MSDRCYQASHKPYQIRLTHGSTVLIPFADVCAEPLRQAAIQRRGVRRRPCLSERLHVLTEAHVDDIHMPYRCLDSCVQRYLESFNIISRTYYTRVHKERDSQLLQGPNGSS